MHAVICVFIVYSSVCIADNSKGRSIAKRMQQAYGAVGKLGCGGRNQPSAHGYMATWLMTSPATPGPGGGGSQCRMGDHPGTS